MDPIWVICSTYLEFACGFQISSSVSSRDLEPAWLDASWHASSWSDCTSCYYGVLPGSIFLDVFFFFKGEGIPARKEWDTPLKINGWNTMMEVWKIIFLSKRVIRRFHVSVVWKTLAKFPIFCKIHQAHGLIWIFGYTNWSGDALPISILTPQSSGEFEDPKTPLLYIQVQKPLHLEGFFGDS